MRHAWLAAVAAVAAACTTPPVPADPIAWRHQDGKPVSAAELSAARTTCRGAIGHQLAFGRGDLTSNPAYHPGGLGLERADRTSGMLGAPDSPFWSAPPPPLDECLASQGIVAASP